MVRRRKTANAVSIIHHRYVKNDPLRKASLRAERVNAEVASIVHQMRVEARMTQVQFAKAIGTTQSVISRLEDADYKGHSLTMLSRIASVMDRELTVAISPRRAG